MSARLDEQPVDVPCDVRPAPLHILHVALQGCLTSGEISYGVTADTGGHIKYLVELVDALQQHPGVKRQVVATRAFDCAALGPAYSREHDTLRPGVALWRCRGRSDAYLPKELLHREVDALADDLCARLLAGGELPDVLHAHYADAGVVASLVKERLGIPFIFTAHSLGKVKAAGCAGTAAARIGCDIDRRVASEQRAMDRADGIVASSRDEIDRQYALYHGSVSGRAVINPPGCDLARFAPDAAPQTHEVARQMQRFLREPDRPAVLAIARPVARKNLAGLLRAFAHCDRLREAANLVIVAGARDDLRDAEPESAAVWRELLELIDRYDLYGQVAMPKAHAVEMVPAIYQWARRRGGVFVNPAVHEPFGLTLLEAAAAGLPVVATDKGGPRDIVSRCLNGVLVDPVDEAAMADAIGTLIADRDGWQRCSSAGAEQAAWFNWERHAQQYVDDCQRMLNPAPIAVETGPLRSSVRQRDRHRLDALIATDMDATLTGDASGISAFAAWLHKRPNWCFVVNTGRTPLAALAMLRRWRAPLPHAVVGAVGSQMLLPDDPDGTGDLSRRWQAQLALNWDRAAIEAALSDLPGLSAQPASEQGLYKLSYTAPRMPNVHAEITHRLARRELRATVVVSHGRLVDVLPVNCSKGSALTFLSNALRIAPAQVIAAGDSGNDVALLQAAQRAIVVANHTGELETLRADRHVYWAARPYAHGLVEGLKFHTGRPDARLSRTVDIHHAA